jgi:hypothetical protein
VRNYLSDCLNTPAEASVYAASEARRDFDQNERLPPEKARISNPFG